MSFETVLPPNDEENSPKEEKKGLKAFMGPALRIYENEERKREAQASFDQLRKTIYDNEEKFEYIDLSQPSSWSMEIDCPDYSIERANLAIDDITTSMEKLKELMPHLPEKNKEEAEQLLLLARLYMSVHDKEEEKDKRRLRLLRLKKDMSAKELASLMEENGLERADKKDLMGIIPPDIYKKEEVRRIILKAKSDIGWDVAHAER